MSNRWANYNGKGKPITPEQLKELLRPFGHQPRYEMRLTGRCKRFGIARTSNERGDISWTGASTNERDTT